MKLKRSRSFKELGQRLLIPHLFNILKDFSYEIIGLTSIKFRMQPPGKGGRTCIFDPGHITKMAAMSTYSKKLKNSSTPVPLG